MSTVSSEPASSVQPIGGGRILWYATWAIVLLLTLPEIVLHGFMQMDTPWMLSAKIGFLAVLFGLTFVWPPSACCGIDADSSGGLRD